MWRRGSDEVTRMAVKVAAVDDGSGGEVEVTWWRRLLLVVGYGGGVGWVWQREWVAKVSGKTEKLSGMSFYIKLL
ncbi:hypothetical protein Tco_0169804 [Tanacetum coccineum]